LNEVQVAAGKQSHRVTREAGVKQIINQIVDFLQQGIAAIFKFVELIWQWSFGQIISTFQSDWQNLPLWKIIVLAAVVIAIAYVLYKAVFELWRAAEQILKAFVGLLMVLVAILPHVLIAGLIAAAGGYVIQHVNF
jgi:hypothetical protein